MKQYAAYEGSDLDWLHSLLHSNKQLEQATTG